jgi:hypothetical protein
LRFPDNPLMPYGSAVKFVIVCVLSASDVGDIVAAVLLLTRLRLFSHVFENTGIDGIE